MTDKKFIIHALDTANEKIYVGARAAVAAIFQSAGFYDKINATTEVERLYIADEFGYHGLKCIKSAGRFSRHSTLNDLIKRALLTAEIPSHLEPVDITRDDNLKRVDGVTIVPWCNGRQLAWDATCVDPLCFSNLQKSSIQACSAAEKAVVRKRKNYSSVINSYLFVAFAVDCLGGWSKEVKQFSKELGRRMSDCTGETRSLLFFRQRISIAIQRGNAASILGTIPEYVTLNEVYYLR